MKHTLFTLLIALTALPGWCGDEDIKNIDLAAMYREVDKAIDKSPQYINDYEQKIWEVKQHLDKTTSVGQKLLQLMDLSKKYESFNGDSALAYTELCLKLAQEHGYTDTEGECLARLAYLCTFMGSQTESLTLLRKIDKSHLDHDALCTYYRAYMMVYSNLMGNTQLTEMRENFQRQYDLYMDSLLTTATPGSEMYYGHHEQIMRQEGKLEEALKENDVRLNMSREGTHENAIVAYSRYTTYEAMGNMEMAKYWLCKSALDDVRNAVMDQMSLVALAGLLNADGDTDRANRYISFTWECNRRYSPRMRMWQIAPLLQAIEQNYQAKLDRKSHIMTILAIASSAAIVVLLFLFLTGVHKRRRMQKAVARYKENNQKLEGEKDKLEWMNDQLKRSNAELMKENLELKENDESHE